MKRKLALPLPALLLTAPALADEAEGYRMDGGVENLTLGMLLGEGV